MPSFTIIGITILIVLVGIGLFALGSSILKWVDEKPTNLDWPLQDIVNGLADLGGPAGDGMVIFSYIVFVGAAVFLIINRNN